MVAHIIVLARGYPDPRKMEPYYRGIEPTLAAYGGRYQALFRHRVTPLEGDWAPPKGVVILEFPSYERALAWYRSPEYAPLIAVRRAAGAIFDFVLVDGLDPESPILTGKLDDWEVERIAELEATSEATPDP